MKKTNKSKKIRKEMKENIPIEIRKLFGKFYLFSLIYIIYYVSYLFFYNKLNKYFMIASNILLLLFYLYMIRDVIKNKKNYNSIAFVFFIGLVISLIVFSMIKLFI